MVRRPIPRGAHHARQLDVGRAGLPGHELPEVERVIERHADDLVIERLGDAGELVRADARRFVIAPLARVSKRPRTSSRSARGMSRCKT
jgi:hypothetical protein